MPTPKTIAVVFLSIVLCACSHPIEIVGDGDVVSATGTRNCYLEDYAAGKDSCARNLIVEGYFETYYAMPRRGWKFARWGNYCEDAGSAECSFKLGAVTVMQYWGASVPPLIAVFSPISQTGPEQPLADFDPLDQRESAEKAAAGIVAEQAARIAAEREVARIAAEQAASVAAQKEADRLAAEQVARMAAEQAAARATAEQAAASVAARQTATSVGSASLGGAASVMGSASLRWSIPTTRQDGMSLRPSELVRYEIHFSAQSTGEETVLVVHNPLQTNFTVSNLPPDVYHFSMLAVDKNGLYSKQSAVVSLNVHSAPY